MVHSMIAFLVIFVFTAVVLFVLITAFWLALFVLALAIVGIAVCNLLDDDDWHGTGYG